MSTSSAISSDRVSRVVGYAVKKGDFRSVSPNLPMRIAILAEANFANQSGLNTEPVEITSLRQAGDLYGYGSPIYHIMRILRPNTAEGVGAIPTVVFAQAQVGGATAKMIEVNITGGPVTSNATHTIIIAGRDNVDFARYSVDIKSGDNVAAITAKYVAAINKVLGCPMTANDEGYAFLLTSKWRGLTANELSVRIDTGGNSLGLSYVLENVQNGSGTPDVSAALAKFGNVWYTLVVNSYGTVTAVLNALEAFNGFPDQSNPTGRFIGTTWKPFIALTGSVSDDASSITDARKDQCTISICPAPLSEGLSMEAAANECLQRAVVAQNSPELDTAGKSYADMPTPTAIGSMTDYNNRDVFVKKGLSTVDLVAGKYQVQDPVTTYHKDGEEPPQFRYVRNLFVDMNVRYGYKLLEEQFVVDHVLANDDDTVSVDKVIKPGVWKAILADYAESLVKRGLIVDAQFMIDSLEVAISSTNPDRFETSFKYKRSGFVRQAATVAEAGFNFGTGV